MQRRPEPTAVVTPTTSAAPPPHRRRATAVERLILDAAKELLAERPYAEFRMEHVAQRARVAKTSLYRRWPSRELLAAAVLAEMAAPALTPLDRQDTRGELLDAVLSEMHDLVSTPFGDVLLALLPELAANPVVRDRVRQGLVAGRRTTIEELVRRAIQRGDLRPDTSLQAATEQLTGPMYYRLIFGGDLDEALAVAVVDAFMRANHHRMESE